MSMTFLYKGFTVEIGDLEGPREAYWKILHAPGDTGAVIGSVNQVECGSFDDLQVIAMRNIDQMFDPNA